MFTRYPTRIIATGVLGTALLVGCASAPPKELENARSAFDQAQASAAQEWTPAQLHEAERTLKLAEATFEAEGDSARTRDRAYVAMRKAQLAEVEGRTLQNQRRLEELQNQMVRAQSSNLEKLQDQYAQQQTELQQTQQAREAAEQRAQQLSQDLAQVAQVREEPRGTVVTLSGSVLFASGESELLPAAQARLSQVARALTQKAKGASVVVEGHTDTQGSQEFNLDLSQRRAEAVKQFLVQQGVPGDRIEAKGLGFSQPVAPNKTAEGRANNRRVEIVLEPMSAGQGSGASSPQPTAGGNTQG